MANPSKSSHAVIVLVVLGGYMDPRGTWPDFADRSNGGFNRPVGCFTRSISNAKTAEEAKSAKAGAAVISERDALSDIGRQVLGPRGNLFGVLTRLSKNTNAFGDWVCDFRPATNLGELTAKNDEHRGLWQLIRQLIQNRCGFAVEKNSHRGTEPQRTGNEFFTGPVAYVVKNAGLVRRLRMS